MHTIRDSAALVFAAACTLSAASAQATPTDPQDRMSAKQAQVAQIVADISAARIDATIRKLAGFGTRHTLSDTTSDNRGIGAARRWIKAELERCGEGRLDVAFDSYVQEVGPRIDHPTEIVNVVATLKGTQSPQRRYVVSGHYDSRVSDVIDATSDAPGANDDASGTAAVMELACVMAQHRFDATLVFMAVAAEEQGLFGATHFAQQAKEKNLDIAGMFTNDIIGSPRAEDGRIDNNHVRLFAEGIPVVKEMTDPLRTLLATGGESDSLSRQLARHVKEMGERYVPGFSVDIIQRRDRYLRGGDHIPFLERGYAALRFTEPNEDFSHQHQNVRSENGVQIGDLPEFVDPGYTAQVTRVNAAALATLALAPAAPSNVRVKVAQLENDTQLVWDANIEPDLAGYRIVWRDTTSPIWQHSQWAGNVSEYGVKGVSKDNVFFGVQAVDNDGNVSVASYPLPMR